MKFETLMKVVGGLGLVITAGSLDLMLFGITTAFWGVLVGLAGCSLFLIECE